MSPSRRQFLKTSVNAAIGATALGAIGAPAIWSQTGVGGIPKRLIIIYLRGGSDPLNVIVPYGDDDYYSYRPTIAIPRPGATDLPDGVRPVLPLNRLFGLHPAMEPLHELYQQGMLAPIISVGSPHETRSHFDAQDFMERAAPGVRSIEEGWLNRYLTQTEKPSDHFLRAFSPQPLLPRSLRGRYSVLAAPGAGSGEALGAFEKLYRPKDVPTPPLVVDEEKKSKKKQEPTKPPVTRDQMNPMIHNAGVNTVEKLRHLNKILAQRDQTIRYPNGPLGRQLADIATVIKAGEPLEISAIDYGGWDHHSYENNQLSRMLAHLSESIAMFVRDLGPEKMKKTMIVTMTEFGRTVKENGSQGSDHGHGGFMLAVGGMIAGGKIYGKWSGLGPRSLYRDRDLPVHTDFRDVFAEVLGGLYEFDAKEKRFFPDYDKLGKPLGLFAKG